MEPERRRVAARLLRDHVAGRITNDALNDGWPLGRGDPALNEIFGPVWATYDDLRTHLFDGDEETARFLLRCAAFLETDHPYEWPRRWWWLWWLRAPLNLITFGLLTRAFADEPEDWWPFAADEDYQRSLAARDDER